MNQNIALKALEILARDYDVNLTTILTEFANKDGACLHAVLDSVAKAGEEVAIPVLFPEWGFTHSTMDKIKTTARNNGKVPAIRFAREEAKRIKEEELGREIDYTPMGLKEAKDFVEEHCVPELREYNAVVYGDAS